MAFNLENMSVDYKKMFRMVPTQRVDLAQSGVINDFLAALTPGQLVSLFPRYYRDQLPDVGQINQYASKLDVALSGGVKYQSSSEGGSYTPMFATPSAPTDPVGSAVQELMFKSGIRNESGNAELNKQYLLDAMNKGGITDPEIRAAMMAVTKGESQFIPRSEQDYSTTSNDRIRSIFSMTARMSDAELTELKKNPETFFNTVYGNRLGNAANEGYLYRGRGFFQLTGKANYERYGKMVGVDLVANPDLANDPIIAAKIAVEYMKDRYDSAPGNDKREKVFRAVGNPVSETEQVKNAAYYEFLQTGEFAPDKVARIENDTSGIGNFNDVPAFDPNLIPQLDDRLQKWYEKAEGMQKKNFELALQKLGVDEFNRTMEKQPLTTATFQAMATPEELTRIGGDAIVNPNQSRVSQDQAELAGVRKLPLQSELVDTMNYAAQKISEETGRNIYLKTFSGGQAPIGSSGPRTGSTEHDLGGAADNYFIEVMPDGTERRLSLSNPEDKSLMYRTAYHFARAGGRSVGLETGYMGDSVHFGVSRNNEDPTHHADKELSAIVDQGRAEFMAEAREKGWDLKYGYKEFFEQERLKRQEEYDKKIKEDAAARANASPVSAMQNEAEKADDEAAKAKATQQAPQADTSNAELIPGSAPSSFAAGGEITPGENIAGVNTDTGKIEFMANDREKIRIDPAELENTQQIPTPQSATENSAALERPITPVRERNPQPVPQPLPDVQMFEDIAAGYTAMPPSVIRAANRAKLYGDTSSGLVNGHFS